MFEAVMIPFMTATQPTTQEAAVFRAVLYPHRSLSPRGFLILMSVIGAISFTAGLVFWWMGAWPVFGFFGLDVLLVYLAFRANYRTARAFEWIELDRKSLKLTRCDPKGRKVSFGFNPYWVRVLLSEDRNGQANLALTSHGKTIEFGRFLNDEERREFASILQDRLAIARAMPS